MVVSWGFMVVSWWYHGGFMGFHGVSWWYHGGITGFHGVSCGFMGFHGVSWFHRWFSLGGITIILLESTKYSTVVSIVL